MKPHLASIRIYPVKGLAPVSLSKATVDAAGALEHDRAWALRDERGRFVNGKNYPAIHSLRWLAVEDHQQLVRAASQRLGLALRLVEKIPGGFPDDPEASGPTVVSRGSLTEVASWFEPEQMSEAGARMRFRANLELDGVPPFWEDQLFPRQFRVGHVVLEGVNPCQRCIVPSRDALTGEVAGGFQKRFMSRRERTLPAWADRTYFTHYYRLTVNTRIAPGQAGKQLHVGDEVSLLS